MAKTKNFIVFALILSMLVTILSIGSFSAYAEGETIISADTTWNGGETVGNLNIEGTTVITVIGEVGVTSEIKITGNVTITGGGTLKRTSNSGNLISVLPGAKLTLENITIDGGGVTVNSAYTNGEETVSASKASAIHVTGSSENNAEVIMNAGAFITNHKKSDNFGRGAAVHMEGGKFTMNGGTISGCESGDHGGAVYLTEKGFLKAEFTMLGGTVKNNKTISSESYGGGAFYIKEGILTINDGTIENNSSSCGGAIYNSSYGTTVINGGTIKDNSATEGKAIYHSCREGQDALLKIGNNANIDLNNDIYLASGVLAEKYIELTSNIKNPLSLTIKEAEEEELEGRTMAEATSGVTLNNTDVSKIRVNGNQYAVKLENNKIIITKKSDSSGGSGEATKYPIVLGYDANGGENAPSAITEEIALGETKNITLSDQRPTRAGYTFLGWATESTATAPAYQPGENFVFGENVTFYAVWRRATTAHEHTYTYTASGNVITESCECGGHTETATITASNGSYTGSEVETASVSYSAGWQGGTLSISYSNNTNVGVATASITKGTAVATTTFTISSAPTSTSRRSHTTTVSTPYYTVDFVTNGGNEIASRKIKSGEKLGSVQPTREDYKFEGWFKDSELKDKFEFTEKIVSNITLYAKWGKDGGEDPNGEPQTGQGGTNKIVLTIDQKDALVFGENKTNDVAPVIRNSRTMLPARFVAENLGAVVEWNQSEKKVTVKKDETEIIIYIDSEKAYINGEEKVLDSPAFIENDRTYTPIRFIGEALGAVVEWNDENRQAIIIKK